MGLPSLLSDIEDRATDNKIMATLFSSGTAGAAGIQEFLKRRRTVKLARKVNQAEAEARGLEERTRRYTEDIRVWLEATADVTPLRKKR